MASANSNAEFDLISDGFFSDPVPVPADEFDFDSDIFSDIEDELATFSLSKYDSVPKWIL